MASYYPPTNYFQNINFNNDFYAAPNNNQGVKLEYANTHYLYSNFGQRNIFLIKFLTKTF